MIMRRIFFSLVLALCFIAPSHGQMMQAIVSGAGAAGPPVCAYPLDAVADTPVVALSMGRKLKSTYSGHAYQLKLTGGTTQDIDFVSGSPCPVPDTATATTFCGSPISNCHVSIIYDQGGNGCNVTQSTFASAPVYNQTGLNSLPTADMAAVGAGGYPFNSGTNNCLLSGTVTYVTSFAVAVVPSGSCSLQMTFAVVGIDSGFPGIAVFWNGNTSHWWNVTRGDGTSLAPNGSQQGTTTCPGATDVVAHTTTSLGTGWTNGTVWSVPDSSSVTVPAQTHFSLLNRDSNDLSFEGQFAELIIFQSISGCDPTSGGNHCQIVRANQIAASGGWNAP